MNLNVVVLTGTLGRDPELKHIPSGTAVVTVGLAVGEKKKFGDQWQDVTTWVDVTAWGRTAEIVAEFCRKGTKLAVHGRLTMDEWQDRQTGQKRSKLKVTADRIEMLTKRSSEDQRPESDRYGEESQVPSHDDSEVPF